MAHIEFTSSTAVADCLFEFIGRGLRDGEVADRLSSASTIERLGHVVTTEDVVVATLTFGKLRPNERVVEAAVQAVSGPSGFHPSLVECVGAFRRLCIASRTNNY